MVIKFQRLIAITQMALLQTPGEDLIVLWRIIKAARPLLASTEQESRAIAAYQSAVERAKSLINENLKREKIHRRNRSSFKAVNRDRHFEVNV
jgi:hypothetical protein